MPQAQAVKCVSVAGQLQELATENEQSEIFELMSEIKDLRQENCKLEEKLSKLDDEIKKVAVNREMDDLEKSEAKDLANQKEFWKIRDKKTAKELRKLKSKFVNGTPKNPNQTIPAELWGYRTSLDKA